METWMHAGNGRTGVCRVLVDLEHQVFRTKAQVRQTSVLDLNRGPARYWGRMVPRTDADTGFICLNSFTGINPSQSQALIEKAHIYLTGNGRISMAGLNTHNIRYFAESLDKAVRGTL